MSARVKCSKEKDVWGDFAEDSVKHDKSLLLRREQ